MRRRHAAALAAAVAAVVAFSVWQRDRGAERLSAAGERRTCSQAERRRAEERRRRAQRLPRRCEQHVGHRHRLAAAVRFISRVGRGGCGRGGGCGSRLCPLLLELLRLCLWASPKRVKALLLVPPRAVAASCLATLAHGLVLGPPLPPVPRAALRFLGDMPTAPPAGEPAAAGAALCAGDRVLVRRRARSHEPHDDGEMAAPCSLGERGAARPAARLDVGAAGDQVRDHSLGAAVGRRVQRRPPDLVAAGATSGVRSSEAQWLGRYSTRVSSGEREQRRWVSSGDSEQR